MAKKLFLILCSICLLSSFMFSNDKDEVLIQISVETDNISEKEGQSLIPSVAEKLEANLTKYTDFTILNTVNQRAIFEIQAKTESDAYENKIAASGFKAPTHELFTTVRSLGKKGYTLSIRFTDLTTSENKTFVSSVRDKKIDLYGTFGSAVDEITIEICNIFGVPLTPIQEVSLMKGESDLSNEEMKALYESEIENYKKRIAMADKELDSTKVSKDIDESIAKAKYRSDKALAEEKLRIAQENKEKLLIAEQKKREQEELDATRSIEQKNRISSMQNELSKKMKEARNFNYQNESVLGQINIIESKKQTLIDITAKVQKEESELISNAIKNIKEKQNEIITSPYKSIETMQDKVTLTPKAKENRINKGREARDEIIKEAKSNIKKLYNSSLSSQNSLLEQILSDSANLKTRYVNTLGSDLVVTFSRYDGETGGWDLEVNVKCDGQTIFSTTSFLSFEKLTGKNPDVYFEEDFDSFSDDVDFYDTLFLRGCDLLVFSLDYDVKALDINHPSLYSFTFNNFSFFDTKTLTLVDNKLTSNLNGSLELTENNITFSLPNVYDLKDYEDSIKKIEGNKTNVALKSASDSTTYLPIMFNTVCPKIITDDSGEHIIFGDYPKSLKKSDVTINKKDVKLINTFTCYRGSDNFYYTLVNDKYFKMEPIEWIRLSDSYFDSDKKESSNLYIAKNIIATSSYKRNNYRGSEIPSSNYQYSDIRAYLNGLDASSYDGKDYTSKGFINRAFTPFAQSLMKNTHVDNSKDSTYSNVLFYEDSPSPYFCDNTFDKLFLLSRRELDRYMYLNGQEQEKYYMRENNLKKVTDYSSQYLSYEKQDDSWQEFSDISHKYYTVTFENKGAGDWYLRTPYDSSSVRFVSSFGYALTKRASTSYSLGLVPCFTISDDNLGF